MEGRRKDGVGVVERGRKEVRGGLWREEGVGGVERGRKEVLGGEMRRRKEDWKWLVGWKGKGRNGKLVQYFVSVKGVLSATMNK